MLDPELKKNLIDTFQDNKIKTTVGPHKSNWYKKIYPKPKIWVTKQTLKQIKK